MGFEENNIRESDIVELRRYVTNFYEPDTFGKYLRCSLIVKNEAESWQDIYKPKNRWKHFASMFDSGKEINIWINWDNRVRFECEGKTILKMWWPAGEILQSIELRRKGTTSV